MFVKSGFMSPAKWLACALVSWPAWAPAAQMPLQAATVSQPGTWKMAVGPGVSTDIPADTRLYPLPAGISPQDTAETFRAFTELQKLLGGIGGTARQSYERLGIYPADPAAFLAGARQMLEEDQVVTRRERATLCARKGELTTAALYREAYDGMVAGVEAWRVTRYREFKASIPAADEAAIASLPQYGPVTPPQGGNAQVQPFILASPQTMQRAMPGMSFVLYPDDLTFQNWRDGRCPNGPE